MAVLEILDALNPTLRIPAKPVTDVDSVQVLIDDMLETMYSTSSGIGLAAPQVGQSLAIVVIDLSENRDDPLILINPEIIEGQGKVVGQEGCLSVPEYYADVERFTSVAVSALDRRGNPVTIENDEFLAIAMQHEIDHLRGKLFIDYLSPLKRQLALRKVKKYLKSLS